LEQQRGEQLTALDQLLQETESVQAELNDLDHPRGEYYREAIELFRAMLERSGSRDLKRRARETEELTDDQIVARLMGVETEMTRLGMRRRNDIVS